MTDPTLLELARVQRERDSYKRAKEENDERFMKERDAARRERDEALDKLAAMTVKKLPTAPDYDRIIAERDEAIAALDEAIAALDEAIAALDELTARVELKSPATGSSESLAKVMLARYGREAAQWKANHDQRKAERDELRAILDAQSARVGPSINDDPVAVANRWNGHSGTSEPDFDMDPEDTASFLASHLIRLSAERDELRKEVERVRAVYDAAMELRSYDEMDAMMGGGIVVGDRHLHGRLSALYNACDASKDPK